MDRRIFITNGLVFLAGLGLAACQTDRGPIKGHPVYRYNEPPERPHQGYRYHYPRAGTMVYDSGLEAYRLVGGHAPRFYYRGRFYRYEKGRWQTRRRPQGRWRKVSARDVPWRLVRWGEHHEDRHEDRHGRRKDAR